jgi:hypothetical protein
MFVKFLFIQYIFYPKYFATHVAMGLTRPRLCASQSGRWLGSLFAASPQILTGN